MFECVGRVGMFCSVVWAFVSVWRPWEIFEVFREFCRALGMFKCFDVFDRFGVVFGGIQKCLDMFEGF